MADGFRESSLRLRPFSAVFVTACTWACAAGLVTALIALGLQAHGNANVYWGAVGGAGAVAAAVAVIRVRLEIDPYEVRVFNVRRTFRIPWESVAKSDTVSLWLSPAIIIPGVTAVRIWTRDGRRVVVDASNYETSKVLDALHRGRSQARVRSPS